MILMEKYQSQKFYFVLELQAQVQKVSENQDFAQHLQLLFYPGDL